jgi:hypothetical protein
MEHKSDCDSYDGEVEDISVDEYRSNTSMSKGEVTDSESDSSVDMQALKWEVKNSGLPHSIKHLGRTWDNWGKKLSCLYAENFLVL